MTELDANNSYARVRTYAWGTDLSGTMQGAGGVGGLLEVVYCGTATTNCFVVYDGNGNVCALVNAADGKTVANYEYGPFGENIRSSGAMAKFNPIRFSTKYQDEESDLVYYGYRFYNESVGRWLSRDPIGEAGDLPLQAQWMTTHQIQSIRGRSRSVQPYVFVDNNSVNRFDVLGLFGDGGGGPGTDNSGHGDFANVTKCPFDYTLEDQGSTRPIPGIGKPERHFRDLPVSQQDVDDAIKSCDSDAFQRAMHRGQDFYSHFNKGYRWDPGNTALPCKGWGHWSGGDPNDPRCGDAPDHDAAAWNAANTWSTGNLAAWRQNCCLRCKAHWWQRSCKWIKRSSGACAPDSP